MAQSAAALGDGMSFLDWFREHEVRMRAGPCIRDANIVVAGQLPPLFEKNPPGLGSLANFSLGRRRDPDMTPAEHFANWTEAAPAALRPFLRDLAAVFGIKSL